MRRDPSVPYLRNPHDEVRTRLVAFIDRGEELRKRSLHLGDLAQWDEGRRTWRDGVLEFLRRQFTTDEESQRFGAIRRTSYSIWTPFSPPGPSADDIEAEHELIRVQVSQASLLSSSDGRCICPSGHVAAM